MNIANAQVIDEPIIDEPILLMLFNPPAGTPTSSITNCYFSNPLWIQKDGEIRTLQPLSTAGTNANFQFSSSTCATYDYDFLTSSTLKIYNGFTGGEIVISLLLFWIFSFLIFNFIVEKFIGFFNKRK